MTFESALKPKLIYVFRINDAAHQGCLKIGETTLSDYNGNALGLMPNSKELNKAARARIDQYTKTAGIEYELLYTETTMYAIRDKIKSFNDKAVHEVLLRSGLKRKVFDQVAGANEWFITDLETVKKAIAAVKEGRKSLLASEVTQEQSPIVFRPEQRNAIEKAKNRLPKSPIILWNAKMRFGKTLAALQVVKDMGFRRTLIMTHRPVVDKGWFEDFGKIFYDTPEFVYGSKNKGESLDTLETSGKHYIYFASIQDLRGAETVGGKFDKHQLTYEIPWDFIIVDEAHEGYQSELGQAVDAALTKPNTKKLLLSGTPYGLFDVVKNEEDVYSWTYTDEQRAKQEWDLTHFGDPNPYASLPVMNIYTYDLGRLLSEFIDEEVAFNFKEFFRVAHDSESFVHEADVRAFLDLLCKKDITSAYPFSNKEFRNTFRHTFWMVPGVKAALALQRLLEQHPVFSQFEVVNVAGEGDPDDPQKNAEALEKVRRAIGDDAEQSRTITLSCGRLTTGVTVPEWTGVFMLKGTLKTSAKEYMQTIFRVQSPWEINGRTKTDAYVFDFAPDRTLKVLAETAKVSARAGKTSADDRAALGEFLNFCPVIGMDGSRMHKMDVDAMFRQLKKVYIERVVNNGFEDGYLYNDELLKLDDVQWQEFQDLKKIIGQTKAMPKTDQVDINSQGLTNEEYQELDQLEQGSKKKKEPLTDEQRRRLEELKKKKKNRDTAVSILRGISIRMPLMIYGAEIKEGEEITLDNFTSLIDPLSWDEFMPRGVSKQQFNAFRKYYDPDIFAAAARRIREMARAADRLAIEDRIERIAQIFSTFRNPDKETVLTPWRVVNMHMSDTLGGYCFFSPDFPKEQDLADPRFVDRGRVTSEVFHPDTRILEINSKTGLYPLYVAYSVYRARLASLLTSPESIEDQWKVWRETVRDNIFVICKTPMAKSITRRTLVGFRHIPVNTRYFEDLINQIKSKPQNFVSKITKGKSYWKAVNDDNMKFNAIVGNPPYQVMDGGAGVSARPVYNLFVDVARSVGPLHLSMIMPAKWYMDGKGLTAFRASMLADKQITKIFDFPDSRDVFPSVDVAGGICYFHWQKGHSGDCCFTTVQKDNRTLNVRSLDSGDTFIRSAEAVNIVNKIKAQESEFYDSKVSTQKPFGLRTYVKPLDAGDIELKTNQGFGPYDSELIKVNKDKINNWKVLCSRLGAEHAGQTDKNGRKRIISSLDLLQPGQICTETYLMIDSFSSEAEARALYKYVQTLLFRFLVSTKTATQQMSKEKFSFVPLQDFTSESDIDWRQPVAEIDRQLYAKYGLDQEEIAFIESMIKPM